MKQANVIRVAVNPSNLTQPVKINDRVFKRKLHIQSKDNNKDMLSLVRQENSEIQSFFKRPISCTKDVYHDKSFIKSFIPKNRVYSIPFYTNK